MRYTRFSIVQNRKKMDSHRRIQLEPGGVLKFKCIHEKLWYWLWYAKLVVTVNV